MFWLALAGCGVETIRVDGERRAYQLVADPGLSTTPGLLLAFHGGGTGPQQMRSCCAIDEAAAAADLVVVYPKGVDGRFNDGRVGEQLEANARGVDDVAFARALVEVVAEDFALDRERVFATGASNGGNLSYRLACEASDVFVGVVGVIAGLAEGLPCEPERPPSVLMVNGTADAYMPIEGGPITDGDASQTDAGRGRVRSQTETFELFRDAAGCTGAAATERIDAVADDGTALDLERHGPCVDGRRVERIRVEGGGHTWAGAAVELPGVLGAYSRELDATETVFDFFARL